MNPEHLLWPSDQHPDYKPAPKPLIQPKEVFLAGEGMAVSQTPGSVMYSLSEDARAAIQQVQAGIVAGSSVNFGFKATVEVTDTENAAGKTVGNVTIAPGLVYDMNWSNDVGWHIREHEIVGGMLSQVEFPALIYGRITIETVESDDGTSSTVQNIEGTSYRIIIVTGTMVKRIREESLPDEDTADLESIYDHVTTEPTPSQNFFQFRVADISADGMVERQYAVGSVTLPQTANPIIRTLSIAPAT